MFNPVIMSQTGIMYRSVEALVPIMKKINQIEYTLTTKEYFGIEMTRFASLVPHQ